MKSYQGDPRPGPNSWKGIEEKGDYLPISILIGLWSNGELFYSRMSLDLVYTTQTIETEYGDDQGSDLLNVPFVNHGLLKGDQLWFGVELISTPGLN